MCYGNYSQDPKYLKFTAPYIYDSIPKYELYASIKTFGIICGTGFDKRKKKFSLNSSFQNDYTYYTKFGDLRQF